MVGESDTDHGVSNGSKRVIDGRLRVYYFGYWIKAYEPPADSLQAKKWLIEALTRRLFNHVEHGLNVPGSRLDEARSAYDAETDPERKRVKGAMLAGALFNRATATFTKLVEIQALGVQIEPDSPLMRQCGAYLVEALDLGKLVLHRSGEEGLDELWGEPFKAFAFPIEEFYKSRYVKIAQSMRAIEQIRDRMVATFAREPMFAGIEPRLRDFGRAAMVNCETLRTDSDIFDIWASLVVAGEHLAAFQPRVPSGAPAEVRRRASLGVDLVRKGQDLAFHITRARVPMPKSMRDYFEQCDAFSEVSGDRLREPERAETTRDPEVPSCQVEDDDLAVAHALNPHARLVG